MAQVESNVCNEMDQFNIQQLPMAILEEIFNKLSLADVSCLGRTCQVFRCAAKTVLNIAVRKLSTKLEKEISLQKQKYLCNCNACALHPTILNMCLSHVRMFQAVFFRRTRRDDDFCFPAGKILDTVVDVLSAVRRNVVTEDVETVASTTLFSRCERFLEFLDMIVGHGIEQETDIGVRIIDLLDCSQASNYEVRLTRVNGSDVYEVRGSYEMRDVANIIQYPDLEPPEIQIKQVIRYLCNYIRWNNLYHQVQNLCDRPSAHVVTNPCSLNPTDNQSHCDKVVEFAQYDAETKSNPDVFAQHRTDLDTRFGITCDVTLRTAEQLPMLIERTWRRPVAEEYDEFEFSRSAHSVVSQTVASKTEQSGSDIGDNSKDSGNSKILFNFSHWVPSALIAQSDQRLMNSIENPINMADSYKTNMKPKEGSKLSMSSPEDQDVRPQFLQNARTFFDHKISNVAPEPAASVQSGTDQGQTSDPQFSDATTLKNKRQGNVTDDTESSLDRPNEMKRQANGEKAETDKDDYSFHMVLKVTCPSPCCDVAICVNEIRVRISEKGTEVSMQEIDQEVQKI